MEKGEIAIVKFNRGNYTSWAFQLQIYLKGKELWGHMDESDPKPIDDTTDSKVVTKWETKNAHILTWILGTVETQYILNLRPHKKAKGMWDHL